MGHKFKLCFVMVKESMSFAECPALLRFKEHHGVDVVHCIL